MEQPRDRSGSILRLSCTAKGVMFLPYAGILQTSLEYIDSHLTQKLTADLLASKAGFSTYHFCRVFRFDVGCSVMDYVRQRRLMFAAVQLSTGRKIIDIALEYGFETHSGFSKAFRRHFGYSPEIYARFGQTTTPALPSLLEMKQYVSGGIIMEPKFVTRSAIKLVGYVLKTTSAANQNSTAIPAFWGAYMSDGRQKKLHEESFASNHAEYGACLPEDPGSGEFDYVIGVEPADGAVISPDYHVCKLPPATYAVFSSPPASAADFVEKIQGTWQFIFNEWFPKSDYEYAEGCSDFEYYDDRGMSSTGKVCDIYIPVTKRGHSEYK